MCRKTATFSFFHHRGSFSYFDAVTARARAVRRERNSQIIIMESANPLFNFANYYSDSQPSDLTFVEQMYSTTKGQDDFAFGHKDEQEEEDDEFDGRENWSIFEKARVDMINASEHIAFETDTMVPPTSSASSISSVQKPRKSWMTNFFHKNLFNKTVAGKQ